MINKRNNIKREKVLFIVPPCITFNDFLHPTFEVKRMQKNDRAYGYVATGMPLGVLSLSAYVKKHISIETKLLDFSVILNKLGRFEHSTFTDFFTEYLSLPEFIDYNPTIIGVSILFASAYQNGLDIIKSCHDIFPHSFLIAGGGIPQNICRRMFDEIPDLNGLCYGEGEKPLLGLLIAGDKQSYLEESSFWITRSKAENSRCLYDFIDDLDEIPFYDYDLCNVADYSFSPAYDRRSGETENFSYMTSRGCPHKCIFCASHTVHGRKVRYHSIDRIREDFKRIREQYGITTIIFQDDYFMGNSKRAHSLLKTMKELGLKAVFQNGLNLYALKTPMIKAISEAGVKHITLPVESGSQRVLKEVMKKPVELQTVKRVVNACRNFGIYVNVSILIGLPGETKKDIEETKAFLKNLNANWIAFIIATPLVGSEMLEICLENDYLYEDYIDSNFKKAIIGTRDFSPDYVNKTVYSMNLELNFVENPDFRLGEYEKALMGFSNTIKSNSDHAFAYYYAGKCYERLGEPEKAQKHFGTAKTLINKYPFWAEYADMFNIKIPEL